MNACRSAIRSLQLGLIRLQHPFACYTFTGFDPFPLFNTFHFAQGENKIKGVNWTLGFMDDFFFKKMEVYTRVAIKNLERSRREDLFMKEVQMI